MSAIAKLEHLPVQVEQPAATPSDLLRYAMEQKADPAYLRELLLLQREWESDQAKKAFVQAMASFKAQTIKIEKDKHVSFTTQKGTTSYDHATIGNVVGVIVSAMAPFGLSHRWITEQKDGRVIVTCEIRHARGHAETTALMASPDDSGGKNSIQAIASTVTYLQRYTLLAATGLATSDQEDDDGEGPKTDERQQEDTDQQKAAKKKAAHDEALARNSESIAHIKERIDAGDATAAADEWRLLSQDDQRALWVAPTKVPGACFTTAQREALRTAAAASSAAQESAQ